jgi:hypothetical protein
MGRVLWMGILGLGRRRLGRRAGGIAARDPTAGRPTDRLHGRDTVGSIAEGEGKRRGVRGAALAATASLLACLH